MTTLEAIVTTQDVIQAIHAIEMHPALKNSLIYKLRKVKAYIGRERGKDTAEPWRPKF